MTKPAPHAPLNDASELLRDPHGLAKRAHDDGYLYLPSLLDKESILETRREIVAVAAAHGLVDAVERPIQSAFVSDGEGTPRYIAYYNDVQKVRSFHSLAQRPELLAALDALFGERALPHPRNILRTVFPGHPESTTEPHQDYRPIKGTTETWTAWIPWEIARVN